MANEGINIPVTVETGAFETLNSALNDVVEGINDANSAVNRIRYSQRHLVTSVNMVRQLTSTMSGSFAAAGKLTGALGGLSTFLAGPWGLAIAAAGYGVSKLINYFDEEEKKAEKVRQKFEAVSKETAAAADNEESVARMKKMREELDAVATSADKLAKGYKELADANRAEESDFSRALGYEQRRLELAREYLRLTLEQKVQNGEMNEDEAKAILEQNDAARREARRKNEMEAEQMKLANKQEELAKARELAEARSKASMEARGKLDSLQVDRIDELGGAEKIVGNYVNRDKRKLELEAMYREEMRALAKKNMEERDKELDAIGKSNIMPEKQARASMAVKKKWNKKFKELTGYESVDDMEDSFKEEGVSYLGRDVENEWTLKYRQMLGDDARKARALAEAMGAVDEKGDVHLTKDSAGKYKEMVQTAQSAAKKTEAESKSADEQVAALEKAVADFTEAVAMLNEKQGMERKNEALAKANKEAAKAAEEQRKADMELSRQAEKDKAEAERRQADKQRARSNKWAIEDGGAKLGLIRKKGVQAEPKAKGEDASRELMFAVSALEKSKQTESLKDDSAAIKVAEAAMKMAERVKNKTEAETRAMTLLAEALAAAADGFKADKFNELRKKAEKLSKGKNKA
ncbi:MAG: hypothetical protein ACI4XO_08620 [Akkermansia sp.]